MLCTIFSFFGAPIARASSLTIQPDGNSGHDAYDQGSAPGGGNHGSETTMKTISLGCFGTSDCPGRSWIKFPLTDIPTGATINSVILTINVESKSGSAGNGNPAIKLQRVTSSWDESTLTSSSLPTYDSGATYDESSTPGGSLGVTSFDITTLARAWIDGTVSNYGVRLSIEGTLENPLSNFAYHITTSEGSTSGNRPKLVVDYTAGSGGGGGGSSDPTPSPSPSPSTASSGSGSSGGGSSSDGGSRVSTPSPSPSPSPTAALGGTVAKKTTVDSCTTVIKDIVLTAQDNIARLTYKTTQPRGTIVYRYDKAKAKNSTTPAVGYDKDSIVSDSNNTVITHDVTLSNLMPQTTYFYTIVATKIGGFSTVVPSCEYSFTTTSPPAASLTTLTGNVYLDSTTTPIPGMKIFFHRRAVDDSRWVGYKTALTDDKGSFAFEYTPTDSYFLGIDPIMTEQGYYFGPSKQTASCPAVQNGTYGFTWQKSLTLPADGCRVALYMTKVPDSYPTMSGKLLENGTTNGVSNTRIQIFNIGTGGSTFMGQVKTNAQGEWSLKYPPNTPIQVQAITDTNRLAGPTKPVYGCKGDNIANNNVLRWQKTVLPATGCSGNIFYITLPQLATGPVFSGTVKDSTNNVPINDVRVVLYTVVDGKETYATQIYTNSAGYWRFVTKPNTAYKAYAYFDVGHTLGYLNGPQSVTTSCQFTKATTVSIQFASVPSTDCLDVTFYARPLAAPDSKTLSGHTVNDLTQAPVGKISIRLAALQTELNSWRVVEDGFTDAQGKWQFSVIPGVKYMVETRYTPGWLHGFKQPTAGCKADKTYFYRLTWQANVLKDNCLSNVFYMMPADGKITGKITLAGGQTGVPNSLQRLWYTVRTSSHELLQYTNSDAQGRYSFDCRKGVSQYKLKQDPSWQFTDFDAYIDTSTTTSRKISSQSRNTYIPILASECREPEPVNLAVSITPNSGTFEKEVKGIAMAYTSSVANHKAEIHYTVNGSRPTITSPLYRGKPLAIGRLQQQAGTQQVILRAVAFGSESEQAEATYYLTAPPSPSPSPSVSPSPEIIDSTLTVTAQPAGDRYTEPVTVVLKANEPISDEVTILYTTDGSDPREGGKTYTEPISFNSTVTLNYVARKASTAQTTELHTDIYSFPNTVVTIIGWDPQPGDEPLYTVICNGETITTTTETSYTNPLQQLDGCVYTITATDKDGKDLGEVRGVLVEAASPARTSTVESLPIASTVAAAGAAAAVVTIHPEVVKTLGSIPFLLQTLWLALLALLRVRKRHTNWGGVYETVLDASVSGAIVSFYQLTTDGQKKLIDRQLSDRNGRYGFLATPGQFQIDVKKTGYIFPSHVSSAIYTGTSINVTDKIPTNMDLFMDPYEVNQQTLRRWRGIRMLAEKLHYPLLIAGTAMTAYDLSKTVTPFTLAVAAVYTGLWIDKTVRLWRGSLERH